MPRVNLTDEELEIIEARRRRNTAAIAHNRAVELCITILEDKPMTDEGYVAHDRAALVSILRDLKEPLRP